jgi:hypothetical protein
MRIAAGSIAVLVALILLVGAAVDASAPVSTEGFRDIGNDVAFNRDLDEIDARRTSEEVHAVVGVAFLVCGLFIFGGSGRKSKNLG